MSNIHTDIEIIEIIDESDNDSETEQESSENSADDEDDEEMENINHNIRQLKDRLINLQHFISLAQDEIQDTFGDIREETDKKNQREEELKLQRSLKRQKKD